MMEAQTVSETLACTSIINPLIAQEDFVVDPMCPPGVSSSVVTRNLQVTLGWLSKTTI
jgi:hypothetical protein